MKKNWKRSGRTYETDRYSLLYHYDEEKFFRSVWPESSFMSLTRGYNRSHIGFIVDNGINDVEYVIDGRNPYFEIRTALNSGKAKFIP